MERIILNSERLYVRPYTLQDEEAFFHLNADPEIMRFIRPVQDRVTSKAFLQQNLAFYKERPGLGRWALVERATEKIVGTFSMLPLEHTEDVHIGYALMKNEWGKGYATEIVKAGITYAFNELKLSTLVAVTFPEHIVSQKVLLRNGFLPAGTYHEEGKDNLLFRLDRP